MSHAKTLMIGLLSSPASCYPSTFQYFRLILSTNLLTSILTILVIMLPSAPSQDHERRALLRNGGRGDKFKASSVAEAYEPATYEHRAPAISQVAD